MQAATPAELRSLSLAAFDYEASARTLIEATVDAPGTILVHGRLLSEIASRLPNAPIQIELSRPRPRQNPAAEAIWSSVMEQSRASPKNGVKNEEQLTEVGLG